MQVEMQGYIKQWRDELESDLWSKPPMYWRVLTYLRCVSDPTTGALRTSLKQIADGVAYFDQGAPKGTSKETVRRILSYLVEQERIEVDDEESSITSIRIRNFKQKYKGVSEGTSQVAKRKKIPKPPSIRSPHIDKIVKHYQATVDPDKGIGKSRLYINAKLRKWKKVDLIIAAVDRFAFECDNDGWVRTNLKPKGIQWFFSSRIDEMVKKVLDQRQDEPEYKEVTLDGLRRTDKPELS